MEVFFVNCLENLIFIKSSRYFLEGEAKFWAKFTLGDYNLYSLKYLYTTFNQWILNGNGNYHTTLVYFNCIYEFSIKYFYDYNTIKCAQFIHTICLIIFDLLESSKKILFKRLNQEIIEVKVTIKSIKKLRDFDLNYPTNKILI